MYRYFIGVGPPGDLDDKKKRWLVIGICLHTILSPTLRKYVDSFVTNLYNSLKLSDQIDIQTQTKHLRTYGATNFYLNYEAINNNKAAHGHSSVLYDYKVQNAVDLSKLFLQTHMSHYTAFDEACYSSALLGMISKIDKFPIMVKAAANDVRSNIRNEWAHCNFTVWDDVNYVQSLQLIKNFIYLLNLNAADEKKIMEELDKWRKNGTSFLQGYTISVELVDELRQKLQVLVEYAEVISQTADTEFGKVHEALIDIGETLIQYDKRISTLENVNSDVHEIKLWKQDSKYFIKTDIVQDILRILENKHCVLLTGVSGIGKTLTAQNIALQLEHEHQYSIVPCISLQDIPKRYKENVRQVFVVDDICGKYTANINIIENWRNITNRVTSILDKGITRILATCRTDVFKEKIVQQAFDLFHKTAYNLSDKYSVKDKLVIASKHLEHYDKMLPDITDIINKNKFSPLMCFLCTRHKNFGINEFLNSPYDTFCKEWDSLKSFDTEKYCVLLLCVIYNGTINDGIFDISNDLEKDEKGN
ncbi:unnamed protein product [Mytilus edulis]|uniref:Novel STAND NTPase 3 domain-containing protein n=1 Tax=Mytilus edulis TaxID=6550 RepID=A0A8S3QPQ4_MYTED|nr:unnamed protein product [Mytilus edulis]